ncbi:DNA-directed RNA polymerase [Bachmanniomyces sp. S44760]|nr:DNA-directed RNA polymerase [Bachmanniomyces sp. S44760]
MLGRATGRKIQHETSRYFAPDFEKLQLPWLCPALLENSRRRTVAFCQRRHGSSCTARSLGRVATHESKNKTRGLASAATATQYDQSPDNQVQIESHPRIRYHTFDPSPLGQPYDPLRQARPSLFGQNQISTLPDINPNSPLIIKDSLAMAPRRLRITNGMGGETTDIHQTLRACLQVGRFERAAAMVRRLSVFYVADAPELIEAHNEYIGMLAGKIVATKDQMLLKHVQRWFEVELKGKGIKPNAMTYALMIRICFQESKATKIARTIRRYIALAEEGGVRDEAMQEALGQLSDHEIGRLTRIAPQTFHAAEEMLAEPKEKMPMAVAGMIEGAGGSHEISPRPVDQKGLGLVSLQKSLSNFTNGDIIPSVDPTSDYREEIQKAYAYMRQKKVEEDTFNSAIERWREETENLKKIDINVSLYGVSSLMWEWQQSLVPLLQEEVQATIKAEQKKDKSSLDLQRCLYGPFLQYITPEKLAAITILTALDVTSTCSTRGSKVSTLVHRIGLAVQDESLAQSMQGGPISNHEKRQRLFKLVKRHSTYIVGVHTEEEEQFMKLFRDQKWSSLIKIKVGAALLSHLLRVAKIEAPRVDPITLQKTPELQPAFWSQHQYDRGKRVGMIRVNEALITKLSREPVGSLLCKHLPMLVEPAPWKGFSQGGYLLRSVPVVRIGSADAQLKTYAKIAANRGDMKQVFAGLDVLGRTGWKINRSIFDTMTKAWNTGQAIGKIPPENPNIQFPPEPDPSSDPGERRRWHFKMKHLENERAGFHSNRCFQNFQLEVAKAYLNETFYFPHSVDFRGRAYPIPPYLNHMGADNCRGLLMFAKGKELGKSGLSWLKVHVANVYGFDKASFKERGDFAMKNLADVYDSADNPLEGRRWWLKAEDPWQCLAACVELKNALESPDPLKFISHLPIHQDGTCNGLQHYAALGGDTMGAKQVNLVPGDRPSDIYTAVAEMIQGEVKKDAAQGIEVAKVLEGKINRKVVKQTVMTNVYGVTFQGARAQVRKQLVELYPDFVDTDSINKYTASTYIARKIFKSLSELFNGARDIQYWFGECATRICQSLSLEQMKEIENRAAGKVKPTKYARPPTNAKKYKDEHYRFRTSVIWTTPLKMPVVQPYREASTRLVLTNLQLVTINQPTSSDAVSRRRQLQAFPPNFIHSLDATHMLLSALKCDEVGLCFAAVHDSFWTHAADVDTMNGILREAFIRMHSEDIIGRLAAEFRARHQGAMYLASVKSDSKLGKQIMAARRKLPKAAKLSEDKQVDRKLRELLMERDRQRLLASSDLQEREEGEAMVTPTKIFQDSSEQGAIAPVEELRAVGIGHMPGSERIETLSPAELGREAEVVSSDVTESHEDFETDTASELWLSEAPDIDTRDTASVTGSDISMDNDSGKEAEAEVGADGQEQVPKTSATPEEKEAAKKRQRLAAAKEAKKTWVWLPFDIPPVPKKGDFDVSRLRDSLYFFS